MTYLSSVERKIYRDKNPLNRASDILKYFAYESRRYRLRLTVRQS